MITWFQTNRTLRRQLATARREARTDPMTGLWNRRKWHEVTDTLMAGRYSFSVILFDMANVKAANAVMGHFAADDLLRRAADVVRHGRGDTAVRMGGDEFALIMPGVSGRDARAVRDRIELSAGFRILKPGVSMFLAGSVMTWGPGDSAATLIEQLTLADLRVEDRKRRIKARRGEALTREAALA